MSGRPFRPGPPGRAAGFPYPPAFGMVKYGFDMSRRSLLPGEAADILQVPLVKVVRWAHEGKIPATLTPEGPRFVESEVRKWAREQGLPEPPRPPRPAPADASPRRAHSLAAAVARGGVTFGLPGRDLYEVLAAAVQRLPFPAAKRDEVLEELLDRESSASTGIGRAVAIPHPRQALELGLEEPAVPVFFLAEPVDWNAIDGRPVRVLFMPFSPSISIHLELLSRLGFCLRAEGFADALAAARTADEVEALIRAAEPPLPA